MASRKLPAIAAIMALFGIITCLFAPAIFQGKILAPLDITSTLLAPWNEEAGSAKPENHCTADALTQYLPYRQFAEKSLKEDGYIGWNPYEMGGYNLAGNTMAVPASWSIQLHRFLSFKDAWNLGLIAEFLTAGLGMLLFLRSRHLGWLACLLGAAVFMANSQFIFWIHHRWALGSFCWMPWVLWAAQGFSWQRPSLRQLTLPLFLALAILGGTLQHMAFVVIAAGCLFIGQSVDFKKPGPAIKPAIAWAMAGVFAFCLAGFSVIPQVEAYLVNIGIGHTRGGLGYEKGLSQPFLQAFLIPLQIWPWLVGDHSSLDGFRLIKSGFMDVAYLGTLPMILGFIGLFRKSMPPAAKWLMLAGLLIPLTPLVGPLYHRVQLLFLLGGAWMAAEMISELARRPSPIISRFLPVGIIALFLSLSSATLIPSSFRSHIEEKVVTTAVRAAGNSFVNDPAWIKSRAIEWTERFSILHPRTAWSIALLALGTAGAAAIQRQGVLPARLGTAAILTASSLELGTLFHQWCTFSPGSQLEARQPAVETLRTIAGQHRVSQRGPLSGFTDTFATPNLLASHMIPSVDAYESIQYRSSFHLLADQAPPIRFALSGVGSTVRRNDEIADPGTELWPSSPVGKNHTLRTNPQPPPMLASGEGTIPDTPSAIIAVLQNATRIEAVSRTMNHVRFQSRDDAGWIRIAQNWHPGWKWRMENESWQEFQKGADACCWIPKAPSAAKIEARFFPRSQGLTLFSTIAACLWILLFLAKAKSSAKS